MPTDHATTAAAPAAATSHQAKNLDATRRVRWDIDADVIRGRQGDAGKKFLPDGLSRPGALGFLGAAEALHLGLSDIDWRAGTIHVVPREVTYVRQFLSGALTTGR